MTQTGVRDARSLEQRVLRVGRPSTALRPSSVTPVFLRVRVFKAVRPEICASPTSVKCARSSARPDKSRETKPSNPGPVRAAKIGSSGGRAHQADGGDPELRGRQFADRLDRAVRRSSLQANLDRPAGRKHRFGRGGVRVGPGNGDSLGGNARVSRLEFRRIKPSACDRGSLRAKVRPEKRDQEGDAHARADGPLFPPLGARPRSDERSLALALVETCSRASPCSMARSWPTTTCAVAGRSSGDFDKSLSTRSDSGTGHLRIERPHGKRFLTGQRA